MKEKTFFCIVILLLLIGFVFTFIHVKYVMDLSKHLSITAFISNEV